MEQETFTVSVAHVYPVGVGVLFNYDVNAARRRVTITGYALVPINAGTVFAEGCYAYIRSPHSPSGRFNMAHFDRFRPIGWTPGHIELDLRPRWLVGYDEASAREWAEGFAEEWNARELAREEVEA